MSKPHGVDAETLTALQQNLTRLARHHRATLAAYPDESLFRWTRTMQTEVAHMLESAVCALAVCHRPADRASGDPRGDPRGRRLDEQSPRE